MAVAGKAFVLTRPWAAVLALAAILVPLVLARWLVTINPSREEKLYQRRRRGLGALVIGADGRASTSKLQVVMWTFAVFFAIAFMLLWGRSVGCGDAAHRDQPKCQGAARARASFTDFLSHGLQPEYYVLLGLPLAAAVAAKAIVSAQVADHGEQTRPKITEAEGQGGPLQSIREVISNDNGETDLLDFQYFAFNLLSLAFFFSQFLTHPAGGLPNLPPTLIALSGLSAATYVTKKGLAGSETAGTVTPAPEAAAPSPKGPKVK